MGIFDLIEDFTEGAVETITRLPEIPIRICKGTVKGVGKGIEKIVDSLEE